MIHSFLNLATEMGIDYSPNLVKKLMRSSGEEVIIKHLEKGLESSLFSYKFISGQLTEHTIIRSPFVINIDGKYTLVKYMNGAYYDASGHVNLNDLAGYRYFELREVVKKKSAKELVSDIINLTPIWSMALLLITPFALITPIYTNIFNTRLIYSSSVTTLLIVSVFFLSAYILEFYIKKIIKNKTLLANAQSAVNFERYVLKFFQSYKGFSAVHSIRSIEQYRKMVWEFIPTIAADILSFVIFFVALSLFVSWLSVYFLIFYAIVFFVFYFYRSRLYKILLDQEQASNDVLKLRVSNMSLKNMIPFVNKFNLFRKYSNTYNVSQHYENNIASFNFYWDELTKLISFLALFTLFVIAFFGINSSELNPAYMIVLFIIGSRLSGLLSQIVTRLSYVKACFMHLEQSLEALFTEDLLNKNNAEVGVSLEEVNKIKITDLSLKEEQRVLVSDVNLKLHKGVLYGLKGKVGSGKSTILRTLIGLNSDYQGKIEYDAIDINVIDSKFFESKVSYLTAETDFFSGTLYDNFLIRNCNSGKLIEKILKECFGNRVFDYQTLYVNDIDSIPMSTGQRRKLLFMLSLLDKSEIYIFDEVIINLSKEDVVKAIALLKDYSKNSIIILASHSESVLSACDVVFEINAHKIITHQ